VGYDLAVYGHLTLDRIFNGFESSVSLGAIGNFWEGVIHTSTNISLDVKPLALGEAMILVDKNHCTRVGRGSLNLKTTKAAISDAAWHHVMYLNQLEDTSFMQEIDKTCVVSADLTAGPMNNLDLLKHLDYLFISDEDLFMAVEDLAGLVKGWVILHYPSGSHCSNGKESFTLTTQTLKNINVLGAGDMFAAAFIVRYLEGEQDVKKCVELAHKNTTQLLLRRNAHESS